MWQRVERIAELPQLLLMLSPLPLILQVVAWILTRVEEADAAAEWMVWRLSHHLAAADNSNHRAVAAAHIEAWTTVVLQKMSCAVEAVVGGMPRAVAHCWVFVAAVAVAGP